ncbi:MAG: hypothetical protein CMD35_02830 [Flavobacteriales bacterium]|nr:hypothetical protein [Flavobacteriales bacterium]
MSLITSTKLVQLLLTFSKKELQGFVEVVENPVYNKQPSLIRIANYLQRNYSSLKEIEKSKLEKDCKAKNLNKDMSALHKLAEEYIVKLALDANPLKKQELKIIELNKRGAKKAFQSAVKSFMEPAESKKIKTNQHLLIDFLVEEECDKAFDRDNQFPFEDSLANKERAIDAWYVHSKLKIYSEMIMRERLKNQKFKKTFYVEVMTFLEKNPSLLELYPSIQIYLKLIDLLNDDLNEMDYDLFYKSITTNIDSFPKEEIANFIQHSINHCIRKINSGHDYLEKLFMAMKFQVEQDLLVIDNQVHHRSCKNIIEVAIRVEEMDWALEFLNSHIEFVVLENKEMIYKYNLASICLANGEEKKALKELTFVNFKDVYYQVSCKVLYIKIYYALNDILEIESLVHNFKSYLTRDTFLSAIQKKMYFNFLAYVLKILQLKNKQINLSLDELNLKKDVLLFEINNEKEIADKHWLTQTVRNF